MGSCRPAFGESSTTRNPRKSLARFTFATSSTKSCWPTAVTSDTQCDPRRAARGVATATLELGLEEARRRGIIRVLLVCETDNPLSRRTILTAGGVLENTHETFERYWIALDEPRGRVDAA